MSLTVEIRSFVGSNGRHLQLNTLQRSRASLLCLPLRTAAFREHCSRTLIEDGKHIPLNCYSNANMAWAGKRSAFSSKSGGEPFLQSTLLSRRMVAGPHKVAELALSAFKQAHSELGMACTLGECCCRFNQKQGGRSESLRTFIWHSETCPKPLRIWSKEQLGQTSDYRQQSQ